MHEPIEVAVNADRTVATIDVPIDGDGTDDASNAALDTLRDDIVPATVGAAARRGDRRDRRDRPVEGLRRPDELGAAPRVHLRAGVRLPADAVRVPLARDRDQGDRAQPAVGGARPTGCSCWSSSTAGSRACSASSSTAGIDPIIPILLFVILFGLSMDYHVFVISKIRELRDRGAGTDEAIKGGITSTAGVVTSAAAVMVGVFACFAALPVPVLQAVRRRPGGRHPAGRHDHPRRAPAGDDEAARRVELVPAAAGSIGCRASPSCAGLVFRKPTPAPTTGA